MLDLTVREALTFFSSSPKVLRRLQVLDEIGLGYLRLGQPATTLSGGEAQRIKIAAHLSSHSGERLLYILDEPTTGLHFDDIAKLLTAFRKLLEAGHTLLVIEHNLDVIKTADYIIDLGPEGGEDGGSIVAHGHAGAGGAGRGVAHRPISAAGARRRPVARLRGGTIGASCIGRDQAWERNRHEPMLIATIASGGSMWAVCADVAACHRSALLVAALPACPARPASRSSRRPRSWRAPDPGTRLRAVQLLKDAAYPEAAIPLATLITDPDDDVQLEAIAAELNIFLAEQIVTRKRVGLLIEVRNKVAAEAGVLAGPLAIGAAPGADRGADGAAHRGPRRRTPASAVEALYAFGTLAVEPGGARRRELLARRLAPISASMVGVGRSGPSLCGRARHRPRLRTAGAATSRSTDGRRRHHRRAERQRPQHPRRRDAGARRDAVRARRAGAHRAVPVLRPRRAGGSVARRDCANRASGEHRRS